MSQEDSAFLYDLRVVVERVDGRPVCGMRIERTGQTSVARADVT